MTYRFGNRSLSRLQGVDANLVRVMQTAITNSPLDFSITEGLRTEARQKELYDQGKTQTMNSKHLKGRAVDIAVLIDGEVTWEFRHYMTVAKHIKTVAEELGIPITWGGDWKTFKDGPHFELK